MKSIPRSGQACSQRECVPELVLPRAPGPGLSEQSRNFISSHPSFLLVSLSSSLLSATDRSWLWSQGLRRARRAWHGAQHLSWHVGCCGPGSEATEGLCLGELLSAPGSWGTLQAETRKDLDQIRNQSLLCPCSQKETRRIQVLSHFLLQSHSYPLPFVVIFMSLAAALGESPGLPLCVCVCVCVRRSPIIDCPF